MSLAAEEICDQYECVGCLLHSTEYCLLLNIKGSNSMLCYKQLQGFLVFLQKFTQELFVC